MSHDIHKLSLCNISTVVIVDRAVDDDKANDVVMNFLEKVANKSDKEFTFGKNEQAVALASQYAVKIEGESVQVLLNYCISVALLQLKI